MHEMAITELIVEEATAVAAGARVTRVQLEIGQLAAVVPDAIWFCFDVCAKGTPVEGAALEIRVIPGRGACAACGAEVPIHDALLPECVCGSAAVTVTQGRELRLCEIELEEVGDVRDVRM